MNLFEYVSLMKEKNTPFAIAGVIILALFLLVIIFKMLGGMRRGTWRQLIRTGMVVLAAIISFSAAVYLSNSIMGSISVEAIEDLVIVADGYIPGIYDSVGGSLSSFDPDIIESLFLLPATIIIIPVLATVIFLIINLILKIARAIIIKIFGFKRAKKNPQRLGGALLSAVEALVWIVMVMLPICGALSLIDQAYDKAISAADDESKVGLIETYDEYLSPFTSNPALCFVENIGAGAMSNGIATVKIDGEKTNMREEVLSIANVILIDAGALKGSNFTALNTEEKAAVTSIVDTLAESPYMSRILVKLMNSVPDIYESGLIPLDELGDEYRVIIDNFMTFLGTVTRENLGNDLTTIKSFYFGFCDSGIMTAITNGEDIMQFVTNDYKGDRHILKMINTLSGNARTQTIVDGLYNLVLNIAFSGSSDSDVNSNGEVIKIEIADIKAGLNNIVSVNKNDYATEEEYREVLSNTIGSTINDTIGVELEEDVVSDIADYVDENYAEQIEDLTDEEFNELIFEVIDIYQSYLNGEEITPDDLEGILGNE